MIQKDITQSINEIKIRDEISLVSKAVRVRTMEAMNEELKKLEIQNTFSIIMTVFQVDGLPRAGVTASGCLNQTEKDLVERTLSSIITSACHQHLKSQ